MRVFGLRSSVCGSGGGPNGDREDRTEQNSSGSETYRLGLAAESKLEMDQQRPDISIHMSSTVGDSWCAAEKPRQAAITRGRSLLNLSAKLNWELG